MIKIMKNNSITVVMIIAALFLLYSPLDANALNVSEVEASLICYACPGEPLNIDRCGGGDQMRAIIKRMIGEGKTKQEILDVFEKQYGETILTIPPKRGFNLVAYVAPFIGLLIGAVVAFLLLKKWGITPQTAGAGAGSAALSNNIQKKINDELSKLDEEE